MGKIKSLVIIADAIIICIPASDSVDCFENPPCITQIEEILIQLENDAIYYILASDKIVAVHKFDRRHTHGKRQSDFS